MNQFNDKGLKDGPWEEYYTVGNGQLWRKGEYNNGELHGVWLVYSWKGHLDVKLEFNNGNQHGIYESYYDNGGLRMKGLNLNNEEIGFWIHYLYNCKTPLKEFYL